MTTTVFFNLAGAILIVLALATVLRLAHQVAAGRSLAGPAEPDELLLEEPFERAA